MATKCFAKPLSKMSKKEKKIAVAKDILKQLRYMRLNPKHYCIADNSNLKYEIESNRDEELKCFVPQMMKSCQVCGIGAFFLSTIGLFNKFKVRDLIGDNYTGTFNNPQAMFDKLKTIFDKEELWSIESAFMRNGYFYLSGWEERGVVAAEFGRQFIDHKKRLRAICLNIVKHGEFKPELGLKGVRAKV